MGYRGKAAPPPYVIGWLSSPVRNSPQGRPMPDIRNRKLLYLKGLLFLLLGIAAAVLIVMENPSWRVVLLLGIAVWAFARAYYFAFYVVQHYVDDRYRFAGLLSFLRYLLGRRQ